MSSKPPTKTPLRRSLWRDLAQPKIWLRCQQAWYRLGLQFQCWRERHAVFRPLFVIATARSGSNLLIDYLGRIPGVECRSEVLCTHRPFGISPRQQNPRSALAHIARSLLSLRAPVRGCKLMLNQLTNCRLTLDRIDSAFPEARYIVLYRESLAEQYLSRESALLTGQWVLLDGERRIETGLHIDPDDLRRFAEETRQQYATILRHSWLRERSLLLSYEELIENPDACLTNRIGPLLGVPASLPQTNMRKQNRLPLHQRVINYQEVAPFLDSRICQQHYAWPEKDSARRAA